MSVFCNVNNVSELFRVAVVCLLVDISGLNGQRSFVVHTLNVDDVDHPSFASLLRNPACGDFKLQFCRSAGDETSLLGSVCYNNICITRDGSNSMKDRIVLLNIQIAGMPAVIPACGHTCRCPCITRGSGSMVRGNFG